MGTRNGAVGTFVGETLNYANVGVTTPIVAINVLQPFDYAINIGRGTRN